MMKNEDIRNEQDKKRLEAAARPYAPDASKAPGTFPTGGTGSGVAAGATGGERGSSVFPGGQDAVDEAWKAVAFPPAVPFNGVAAQTAPVV